MKVYTYNDKVLVNSANDKWLKAAPTPIVLPPYTIRIKLITGSTAPTIGGASVTPVNGMADVYDVCTATAGRGTIWGGMLAARTQGIREPIIEEIIAINALDANNANPATVQALFTEQVNVKSGILNAYNYLSSTVTTYDSSTFKYCGSDTVTGAAELAQIPTSWGGTAS